MEPKRRSRYLPWKILIYALLLLMVLPLTVPAAIVLHKTTETSLALKILSGAGLVFFLLLQGRLLFGSDLSGISAARYLAGEGLCYALFALAGALTGLAVNKGLPAPQVFSYFYVPFFPTLFCSFLTGNLIWGAMLQTAAYVLIVYLLYLLKKKKDPSLKGRKNRTVPPQAPPQEEEETANGISGNEETK